MTMSIGDRPYFYMFHVWCQLSLYYGSLLSRTNKTSILTVKIQFILYSCIDYVLMTTIDLKYFLKLLQYIHMILEELFNIIGSTDIRNKNSYWYSIMDRLSENLIRLLDWCIQQHSIINLDLIVRDNISSVLLVPFEQSLITTNYKYEQRKSTLFCNKTTLSYIINLFNTISIQTAGKRHLRRLGLVKTILYICKQIGPTSITYDILNLFSKLLSGQDLRKENIIKRIAQMLNIKISNVFQDFLQTLTTVDEIRQNLSYVNDNAFESTDQNLTTFHDLIPKFKNIIDFIQIVQRFLLHTPIAIEIGKINLIISIIIDIILIFHELEPYSQRIEQTHNTVTVDTIRETYKNMVDLLWTLSFTVNSHDSIKKRAEFVRLLRLQNTQSPSHINIYFDGILWNLDNSSGAEHMMNGPTESDTDQLTTNLIMNVSNDTIDTNIRIRDRLTRENYNVEIITLKCPDIFSLKDITSCIEKSSLTIICANNEMKTDNLSRLCVILNRYLNKPLITIVVENEFDVEDSWLSTTITETKITANFSNHFDFSNELLVAEINQILTTDKPKTPRTITLPDIVRDEQHHSNDKRRFQRKIISRPASASTLYQTPPTVSFSDHKSSTTSSRKDVRSLSINSDQLSENQTNNDNSNNNGELSSFDNQQITQSFHFQHETRPQNSVACVTRNYMLRPLSQWTEYDVSDWCEANSFHCLEPLIIRLNGQALINLSEILNIEPAAMYHSLNEELLTRTGNNLPITEYVSLRSELQKLLARRVIRKKRTKIKFCAIL
ncbi:unnamed protein product [Didymodactylos carnosus]|uniref:Uncharacterized protein n=1 Tax=Didymodactylos carnosus TaxID=1234261 RepID=A0A814SIR9_9BILA|nr:unnamed protein product [Didymodactylos carnosus]CAF3911543.1 unnamed protein product [Didymodactylos carnosus]